LPTPAPASLEASGLLQAVVKREPEEVQELLPSGGQVGEERLGATYFRTLEVIVVSRSFVTPRLRRLTCPACLEYGLLCPPQADARDTSGLADRAALAPAGPTPPPDRDEAGVPVQATTSAGTGMYSMEHFEQWAAELGERERVLRLREEALRRREGTLTDTEIGGSDLTPRRSSLMLCD
jgi:hypothetical protein